MDASNYFAREAMLAMLWKITRYINAHQKVKLYINYMWSKESAHKIRVFFSRSAKYVTDRAILELPLRLAVERDDLLSAPMSRNFHQH